MGVHIDAFRRGQFKDANQSVRQFVFERIFNMFFKSLFRRPFPSERAQIRESAFPAGFQCFGNLALNQRQAARRLPLGVLD